MVGAHYDLEGTDCFTFDLPDDNICNGAADNAAGVAAAFMTATDFASTTAPVSGERSMIIAFWDGEEDGLVGSRASVADPLVPFDQTVVYVNFDIQGANLLRSLANTTILVGAETGGLLYRCQQRLLSHRARRRRSYEFPEARPADRDRDGADPRSHGHLDTTGSCHRCAAQQLSSCPSGDQPDSVGSGERALLG
jgi:hypothetical protein